MLDCIHSYLCGDSGLDIPDCSLWKTKIPMVTLHPHSETLKCMIRNREVVCRMPGSRELGGVSKTESQPQCVTGCKRGLSSPVEPRANKVKRKSK